jgi:hypothetical protein
MSERAAVWKKRVASWRASGKTAEAFSEGRPWSAGTLRWWSSRLRRELTARARAPEVRFAQVIRSATPDQVRGGGAVVVDWLEARLRITIEPGADREAVATVLELFAARSGR